MNNIDIFSIFHKMNITRIKKNLGSGCSHLAHTEETVYTDDNGNKVEPRKVYSIKAVLNGIEYYVDLGTSPNHLTQENYQEIENTIKDKINEQHRSEEVI